MTRRRRRLLCIPAAAVLILAVVQLAEGFGGGLGFMAPAILVTLPLLMGRYVGEERIARLAGRVRARRGRRLAPRIRGRARPVARVLSRGGALIARSLAVRPPPSHLPA